MNSKLRKWLPLIGVAGFILLIDWLTKSWVLANMILGETITPIPALSPFFQLTRSTNTGFAFGIGEGGSIIALILPAIITVVLLYYYARTESKLLLQQIAMSMVVGGALGNLIDRLQFGHVNDFVHFVIPGVVSNVSNLADHAIVLGVILLLIDSFLQERREKRLRKQLEQESEKPILTD